MVQDSLCRWHGWAHLLNSLQAPNMNQSLGNWPSTLFPMDSLGILMAKHKTHQNSVMQWARLPLC